MRQSQSVTITDVRSWWQLAQMSVDEILQRRVGEFMRPELEAAAAMQLLASPAAVRRMIPPDQMQRMMEVFGA